MNEWFLMHGYGLYIWPAYGLVFAVLLLNIVSIKWQGMRIRKMIKQWLHRSLS